MKLIILSSSAFISFTNHFHQSPNAEPLLPNVLPMQESLTTTEDLDIEFDLLCNAIPLPNDEPIPPPEIVISNDINQSIPTVSSRPHIIIYRQPSTNEA